MRGPGRGVNELSARRQGWGQKHRRVCFPSSPQKRALVALAVSNTRTKN
jgi:hypothetical protein